MTQSSTSRFSAGDCHAVSVEALHAADVTPVKSAHQSATPSFTPTRPALYRSGSTELIVWDGTQSVGYWDVGNGGDTLIVAYGPKLDPNNGCATRFTSWGSLIQHLAKQGIRVVRAY